MNSRYHYLTMLLLLFMGTGSLKAQCLAESYAHYPAEGVDAFGSASAMTPELLALGAPLAEFDSSAIGIVYAYGAQGANYFLEDELVASDAAQGDWFGAALDASASTLVVGSPFDDDVGNTSGSVYIFVRTDSGWVEQQKFQASDGEAGDRFGSSVSIYGDLIVVGAPQEDSLADNAGAAYVFELQGGVWVEIAKLTALDGGVDAQLGLSVDTDGLSIIVGAPGADASTGAAYIFVSNSGTWAQQAKLTTSLPFIGDFTGSSVAIEDDLVLFSSPEADAGLGRVDLYRRIGASWTFEYMVGGVSTRNSSGQAVHLESGAAIIAHKKQIEQHIAVGATWQLEMVIAQDYSLGVYDSMAVSGARILVGRSSQESAQLLYTGIENDCNNNGVEDHCEYFAGETVDCNANGLPDECDVASGFSEDCNANSFPDECEAQRQGLLIVPELGVGAFYPKKIVMDGTRAVVIGIHVGGFGAIIFKWNGQRWVEEQFLPNSIGDNSDVALSGDWLFLSDPQHPIDAGWVKAFKYINDEWILQQTLTGTPQSYPFPRFGASIVASESLLVVASPSDGQDNSFGGHVYSYELDSSGTWNLTAELSSTFSSQALGAALALDNDRLLVGSRGLAESYRHQADGSWLPEAEISLPTFVAPSQILSSGPYVALSMSETLCCPKPSFTYQFINGQWVSRGQLQTPYPREDSKVLGLDGNRLLVGMPTVTHSGLSEVGVALLYEIGETRATLQGWLRPEPDITIYKFGSSGAIHAGLSLIGGLGAVGVPTPFITNDCNGNGILDECEGVVCPTYIRGDVNQDQVLDIADAIELLSFLFGGEAVGCEASLDANDDDSIDLGDPIYYLGFLFGQNYLLAPPFPNCGVEPKHAAGPCENSSCP